MLMWSLSLTHQTAGTMSPIRVASSEICSREQDESEFHHQHMAWVLVADKTGTPRPRLRWLTD